MVLQGPLLLSSEQELSPIEAPWAGQFLALGRRLATRKASSSTAQLVIAVTVPARDYAALLVAAGWMLSRPAVMLATPGEVAATLERGTPVRAVTDQLVLADRFFGVRAGRMQIGKSFWPVEKIKYLSPAPDLTSAHFGRMSEVEPGALSRALGDPVSRSTRMCVSGSDLAILGTKSWLEEEFEIAITLTHGSSGSDRMRDLLLPDLGHPPAWLTVVRSAQTIQELDLSPDLSAVVLDGASAIRWLSEVVSPIVVAIIDRSSSDESAAEMVKQVLGHGNRLALENLAWKPPRGAEALAFEVPL